MVEAPNLQRLHPTSILYVNKVFQHHDDMLWMGICVRPYPAMPVQVRRGFQENWGRADEWCCNVMVEVPNPLGVHPTSVLYVYKVFQHLDMLWMGICVRPNPVMPVQVGILFLGNWGRAQIE